MTDFSNLNCKQSAILPSLIITQQTQIKTRKKEMLTRKEIYDLIAEFPFTLTDSLLHS